VLPATVARNCPGSPGLPPTEPRPLQSTWTLASRPLPGTKDDVQDTLGFFAQAVANVDLTNGRGSAPGGQFLIGSILTLF